jgi:hypothetical protein
VCPVVKLNILKKIHSHFSKPSFHNSANGTPTRKTRRFWHFSKLEKAVLAITITAILLVSAFGLLMNANPQQSIVVQPQNYDPTATPTQTIDPTSTATAPPAPSEFPVYKNVGGQVGGWVQPAQTEKPSGLIESSPIINSTVWRQIAANAWNYFQPGRGIDSTTGLPASSLGWNYFTDWDLAVYIQAVMDAQKIGLISKDGDWGSAARLNKVVVFLETRALNGTTPYWFYNSDGTPYLSQPSVNVADSGTLLVALNNVKTFDSSFSSRIDNVVYNRASSSMPINSGSRTDYQSFALPLKDESFITTNIYAYYTAVGFASFFPQLAGAPDNILKNIQKAGNVTINNSTIPQANILCEPLLYSVFNLRGTPNFNTYLVTLMNQTYSVHEAQYNSTGRYIAFSEGIGPSDFIWEWVVLSNGDTWKITNPDGSYADINPVIYTKVSLSFLALYNTTFARDMSLYLEKVSSDPSNGYCAGADYNKNPSAANLYSSIEGNTNGLIISAALYALSS